MLFDVASYREVSEDGVIQATNPKHGGQHQHAKPAARNRTRQDADQFICRSFRVDQQGWDTLQQSPRKAAGFLLLNGMGCMHQIVHLTIPPWALAMQQLENDCLKGTAPTLSVPARSPVPGIRWRRW
jgi:hypothetical protein